MPDLNATAAANLRVIGDNYAPARPVVRTRRPAPGADLMRSVVDPLIERQIKSITSSKGDLKAA
jgi:hypothetical protein